MATKAGPNIITDGLVLNIDPANVKSYPAKNDPYRDQVSLLLDGESLTDKSKNAVAVTVEGSVTVDSSFKKVGNSSLKFGGALADSLSVPSSSLFAFPGDFTIEFWTYANQWGQRSGATVYFCNGVLNQFQLGAYPSATQINLYLNGSSFITASLSASIVGRWVHIALVRSGSAIKIYENGTVVGSGTSSYSVPASICYIGKQLPRSPINYGHNLDGYIDDFQITKVAKYTANFTPPTAPLSLPSTIKDIKNNSIGTLTNGPVYSSVQNGIVSFIGANVGSAGTSIRFSNNSTYDVQSSNFSICAWCNPKEQLNYGIIAGKWGGYGVSNLKSFALRQDNGQHFQFGISSNGSTETLVTNSATFSLGEWYHICATRDGNNVYLYTNGVVTSSGSFSGSVYTSSTDFTVGAANNNTDTFKGNISDVKFYSKSLSSDEVQKNYIATRKRFVETPKTIPGLQLWLDGADLSTMRQNSNGTTAVALNSDPVGYWGDKSGNGRNATQATAGNRPLFNIDSTGPYLNLNGTSSVLTGSIPLTITELTAYAIFSIGSGGYTYARLFTIWDNTSGASAKDWNIADKMILMYKPSASAMGINRNQAAQNTSHSLTYDQNYLFKAQHTGSVGSSQVNNGTPQSITWNHNGYYNAFNIGTEPNYAGYLKGKVREIIFFNRSLSSEEDVIIKNYLNQKWNIF